MDFAAERARLMQIVSIMSAFTEAASVSSCLVIASATFEIIASACLSQPPRAVKTMGSYRMPR
eukprot:8330724-Karenia_brevis.AAC.1